MFAIHLRDTNSDVVAAWETCFARDYLVTVSCGDIFGAKADAIISPANSFGWMDGGIDLDYCTHFGFQLQDRLQAFLLEHFHGELPVGQAVIIPTGHAEIPFLVSAPTMRVPGSISRTINPYLAFRAALVAVIGHNRANKPPIQSILVPGLGTGAGEVPPERAARQMKMAFDAIMRAENGQLPNRGQILADQMKLLS